MQKSRNYNANILCHSLASAGLEQHFCCTSFSLFLFWAMTQALIIMTCHISNSDTATVDGRKHKLLNGFVNRQHVTEVAGQI